MIAKDHLRDGLDGRPIVVSRGGCSACAYAYAHSSLLLAGLGQSTLVIHPAKTEAHEPETLEQHGVGDFTMNDFNWDSSRGGRRQRGVVTLWRYRTDGHITPSFPSMLDQECSGTY